MPLPWNRLIKRAARLSRAAPFAAAMRDVQDTVQDALARAAKAASPVAVVPVERGTSFAQGVHDVRGMSRHYRLYTPARLAAPPALVVMLHGCTQDAADFATGTRMNDAADAGGFLVLYPEQGRANNPSRCWNWFGAAEAAGGGEVAFLADLVRTVVASHGVDPRRVFVAGLSAGGAMAALVAAAQPAAYAAIAVHSGLPAGAARNLPDALRAMRDGARRRGVSPRDALVPTIVLHGDADRTVHPDNGLRVIEALAGEAAPARRENGDGFDRAIYRGPDGRVVAEHWALRGAGHAWAGGDAAGSFTAPDGIDATGAIVRFFEDHGLRSRA